ncbi:hypothetical protein I4F81_003182 [Pyropia yezoensis]|uniref:Uncharacterized protein n=1 Tax=Pyropia yezoensis TaxID=2788 RepID=A0ACC3BRL5_PYRYE|nr:hypothetical protein I4F81_003182 [Neopyropia yezoensis]
MRFGIGGPLRNAALRIRRSTRLAAGGWAVAGWALAHAGWRGAWGWRTLIVAGWSLAAAGLEWLYAVQLAVGSRCRVVAGRGGAGRWLRARPRWVAWGWRSLAVAGWLLATRGAPPALPPHHPRQRPHAGAAPPATPRPRRGTRVAQGAPTRRRRGRHDGRHPTARGTPPRGPTGGHRRARPPRAAAAGRFGAPSCRCGRDAVVTTAVVRPARRPLQRRPTTTRTTL